MACSWSWSFESRYTRLIIALLALLLTCTAATNVDRFSDLLGVRGALQRKDFGTYSAGMQSL